MQKGIIACRHEDFEVVVHDPQHLLTPADLNSIAYGHEYKEHKGYLSCSTHIERLNGQHSKQIIHKLIAS